MIFVAHKWFSAKTANAVPPNHGLAIAGAKRAPLEIVGQESLGTTIGPFSYVWVDMIEEACSPAGKFPNLSGATAVLVGAEVLVHEMLHQWKVNAATGEHCDQDSYADPSKACLMNPSTPKGQHDDNHLGLHYDKTTTPPGSEYLEIRRAQEPRP